MNWKYLPAFVVAVLLIVVFVFATRKAEDKNFEAAKEVIVIRKIGHEILLQSGDSTSRVLPVRQLSENEYQLQFESRFSFQPDSLVSIIHRLIAANKLPPDYIVNVIECSNKEVIFGFAMLGTEHKNIVPCAGRKQPENCYFINLRFQNPGLTGFPKIFIAAIILAGSALFLFFLRLYNKKKKVAINNQTNSEPIKDKGVQIGNYLFYNDEQYLVINETKIELTSKESQLLYIFAGSPNQIIDRSRLQKEVWEDEGVIVSRSLDMFISKLRKKLEKDPAVKLINVHGKGYKLEVS